MRLLLPSSLLAVVGAYVLREQERPQMPIVEDGKREKRMPGIGVHLTTSYAVAAIRYENGTTENVVRVTAGAEYIDLMAHWADPASKRICDTEWEKLLCDVAQKRRRWNKFLGRPATSEVGTLASMLQDVKGALAHKLRAEVKAINPVFPMLAGLEQEDVQDAIEYAGLEWPSYRSWSVYWETNAGYMGLGHGLCKSWDNPRGCFREEMHMPYERALFLNFDNSSFEVVVQLMKTAKWQVTPDAYTLEMDLGRWNLPMYEAPRASFWARIHKTIVDIGSSGYGEIHKVYLLGQHASDSEFLDVVKGAIKEIFGNAEILQVQEAGNTEMLAARGSAEWAYRAANVRQEDEESEAGMMEL